MWEEKNAGKFKYSSLWIEYNYRIYDRKKVFHPKKNWASITRSIQNFLAVVLIHLSEIKYNL
jgi:hypothetical protein